MAIAICLRLFALSIGAPGSPTASSAYSGTSGVALPECTVKTPLLKKAWTAILPPCRSPPMMGQGWSVGGFTDW
jgi:hypothetical protein